MRMERRDSFEFFVSEGGAESPSPSLTPSPASTPSPPAGASAGSVRSDDGSGRGSELAAASSDFAVGGMSIALGRGKGIMGAAGDGGGEGELGRKKSGSPRKYEADVTALALTPRSSSPFSPASDFSGKRGRGRPRGSGKRQLLATLARILSFSQKGPRAICILSANGAISNVTLRQPGSSGGILTFEARTTIFLLPFICQWQLFMFFNFCVKLIARSNKRTAGRFEILTLSGSFTITDSGGIRSRTGGLSVSLAGPDGRVIGGGVAGLLLAASPIQVVVGSFTPNAFKEQRRNLNSDTSPISPMLTAVTQISQTTVEGERVASHAGMPVPNTSNDANNSKNAPNLNPSSFQSVRWQGLQPPSEQKLSPDINICLHRE
ncbi:hypothetical protein AXF42_Ash014759 [Apostasia shenzhenica]|uniref:AT-hook motif nuclear-localized protein n=1 Tax=Apostasia shenzhenica TaxID=1088818 RepID=A0A2H9ZWB3_9ASPA|nr:hypothetical protein AXF42_Ash014759 [Apostasia shenzhenica]